MTPALAATLPVDSFWVPSWLDSIINKKIANVALSRLEALIDWLCSCLYPPYSNVYHQKIGRIHYLGAPINKRNIDENPIPCLDRTKGGQVRINDQWKSDGISINGYKVRSQKRRMGLAFSRAKGTKYVAVQDAGPGWYQIIEHRLPSENNKRKEMANVWNVNGAQLHKFKNRKGRVSEDSVYFADAVNFGEPSSPLGEPLD